MKMLICGCMVFLSASMLRAADVDGGFLAALMTRGQHHANSPAQEHKNSEILGHATVDPLLPTQAETLEGQPIDPADALKTKEEKNASAEFSDATAPSEPLAELKNEKEKEDLGTNGLIERENSNGPLDLKLQSNLEGAGAVRMAEPTASAAAAA